MRLTQPFVSVADTFPARIACIDGPIRRTWREHRDRVVRLAGALRALGARHGARVAILARNGACFTECLFATWWAGGAVVPLNTRWSASEIVHALGDCEARILFLDDAFLPMLEEIRACADTLTTIVTLGSAGAAGAGLAAYEDLVAQGHPCADAMRGGEDLAGLFYTGGTTGIPKGVMLPHRALWYNAMAIAAELGLDREAVWLHAAPMFHLADFTSNTAIALVGGCHVYIPAFDPEAALAAIEAHGVNSTILVPTMLARMLDHPGFAPARTASLRRLLYGASPMPEGLLRKALGAMPHVRFFQGYGQTEMGPGVTILAPGDHVLEGPSAARLRSAGLPTIGCEVRILGPAGDPAPRGTIGEIAATSPGMMLGYWNQPEQTRAVLVDGWVRTGDAGYQDEDGFVHVVDRLKDMIVTGGENVFCAEVENAISTHPAVGAVAVIGIPSRQWGEAVHAIVIPRPGAAVTQEDIIAHCRARIAGYKCPRSVSFRAEPFPLSGAGKVLKRELRAPFWQGLDCGVA
ncbi:AMP-binding protein [Erythrobacter sp.]|uniref:AMP-binding protein n=1 Tax=Erythrobacter sp. TaxID=1042 RepID=UPI0025F58AA1|nr:AMP-binding protein [Erythrobacter sp.]